MEIQVKTIDIHLKKIKKEYGEQQVLKDINLDIKNGDFIAICGKSGAGKSTFINILGLIEACDSGEYWFNEKLLKKNKDYSDIRRDYIGFIFQSYNLISNLTCEENILLPTIYSGMNLRERQSRLNELAEVMNIKDLLEKKSSILSGGEKQRVAIARALMLNPSLIIADEPTGNLDEINKNIVLKTLLQEQKNNRAIVLITHDLEIANSADKVYYLSDGKLSDEKIF